MQRCTIHCLRALPADILRGQCRGLSSQKKILGNVSSLSDKPFYITTPIFYPNSVPHIGHLYSLVVADVFARYAKLAYEREVVFVTGTDEHGLKIQKTAKEKGLSPLQLCDNLSVIFRDLTRKANVTNPIFMRTTSKEHVSGVIYFWNELLKHGYIYKGKHSGWYSISDECFYTDSQVTSRIDPETGQEVRISIETGNTVEWSEETNYKFAMSKFRTKLLDYYMVNPHIIYPEHQYTEVMKQLVSNEPNSLPDLSVSRPSSRLSWGIPVPGDESQTIYVWLDALTTYLTGVGYPWASNNGQPGQSGWPADLQVIGKDILKFHAIYFPAFLMALDLPLPKGLLSHSHWTVNKAKMSKSVGNVVDPLEEIHKRGVDVVRWYLARVGGRFKDDVDWSEVQLSKHEDEIRSLLGNSLLRLQSKKILNRLSPELKDVPLDLTILGDRNPNLIVSPDGDTLIYSLENLRAKVIEQISKAEVADALQAIVDCLVIANKEFTLNEPWKDKTDQRVIETVIVWSREALRICGILLQPFIPEKANELLDALLVRPEERTWDRACIGTGEVDPGPMKRVVLFTNVNSDNR